MLLFFLLSSSNRDLLVPLLKLAAQINNDHFQIARDDPIHYHDTVSTKDLLLTMLIVFELYYFSTDSTGLSLYKIKSLLLHRYCFIFSTFARVTDNILLQAI